MAFFKFRKGDDDAIAAPAQPESVEALRRRARHRLIGAAVLVLVGVLGFPLLFDTQPRPVAVDIPIDIPDRNKARPLAPPPPAPAPAAVSEAPVAEPAPAPAPAPKATLEPAAAAAPAPEPPPPAAPRPEPRAAVAAKTPPPSAKSADDSARARALLEGKAAASQDAGDDRFVVQVGAFADAAKAREARLKLERAGLKTYTHVAETKDGKRIRVRTGPYASRAEADKAAQKIKSLELPAAILTL